MKEMIVSVIVALLFSVIAIGAFIGVNAWGDNTFCPYDRAAVLGCSHDQSACDQAGGTYLWAGCSGAPAMCDDEHGNLIQINGSEWLWGCPDMQSSNKCYVGGGNYRSWVHQLIKDVIGW